MIITSYDTALLTVQFVIYNISEKSKTWAKLPFSLSSYISKDILSCIKLFKMLF